MVLIIVRWYIKNDQEAEFRKKWISMVPTIPDGLFREFFSAPYFTDKNISDKNISERNIAAQNKYHTLDLESPHYKTIINVGVWNTVNDFDVAIGQYIPEPKEDKDDREKVNFSIFNFEFKMRERIVVEVELTRGGDWVLPPPNIVGKEKVITDAKVAKEFFKESEGIYLERLENKD